MSSEDEANSKLVKRYVRLAIVSAFLLAFFWPLGSFFFWIFFGAGSYFTFLAFYNRPRPKPEATREEYARHEWHQPDQGSNVRIAPKNIKLIVGVVVIAAFFFLLILMIIGFATGDNSSPQNVEEISINENRELLSSDPNNIDALTNLGNSFYATSEYDSALVYYEKVIKIDPQNSSGLYNKGLTLYSKKEYQNSMEVLRLCISLYPDNTDALMVMGDNHYSQDQFEQAMTWYKQAYSKGVRTSGLLNVMAYIYDQQKQNSEAIRFYKEALQQDSSLVDIYNRLAELEPERAAWYKKKAEAWK
jgi:tetratricopeptide (TPR) repeat protein